MELGERRYAEKPSKEIGEGRTEGTLTFQIIVRTGEIGASLAWDVQQNKGMAFRYEKKRRGHPSQMVAVIACKS